MNFFDKQVWINEFRSFPVHRVEDDEESSESEVFRRLRREEPDNAVGKVVLVETNEKRKNLWFPALVSHVCFRGMILCLGLKLWQS